MSQSSTLVRAARKSRLLTQQQLAERSRVDQASVSRSENGREADFSTIERLLAGAGHRLYAAPTLRGDASSVASEIKTRLRVGDRDRALRALIQLNDDLLAEHGLVRGVLGLAEPESTGDASWDAAIAALVAWRLKDEDLPTPDWVDGANRRLPFPHVLTVDPADPVPPIFEVPSEFAARNVLAWRDTFESI